MKELGLAVMLLILFVEEPGGMFQIPAITID
jgi:hypothetical protein